MSKLTRLLVCSLSLLCATGLPVRAYTVEEMKGLEAKVKKLVEKNTPAVISLFGESVPGAGSGTIVSEDGIILTAAHVTKGNEHMVVLFPNGKEARCKVLGADYTRDVSLAKIEQPGKYPFVEIGDSDKLEVTTFVVAMGHPGGFDPRRTPPVRIGRIETANLGGFLVSDATLISGDSGGPLFNLEGQVVGVHSSISNDLDFNRDAPTSAAKKDWDRLMAGDRWGSLNAGGDEPPVRENRRPVIGGALDPDSTDGVKVVDVYEKSPLQEAGLQVGDVISKIGDTAVKNADQLVAEIGKSKPGDKIHLTYSRHGEEHGADVSLISRAEMNRRLGIENRPRRNRGEAPPPAPAPDSSKPPKP